MGNGRNGEVVLIGGFLWLRVGMSRWVSYDDEDLDVTCSVYFPFTFGSLSPRADEQGNFYVSCGVETFCV